MSRRARASLLGVWAHPDDEAYLSAGLMAEFIRGGGHVAVVTATYGELGTADPTRWPPRRLAVRRAHELRDSLAVLGVTDVQVLGLPDGGCAWFDGTALIAEQIERRRPDVIVTFGPDGLTGHRDHRAVSRWTTAAHAAVRPQAELWYATVTDEFHARWGAVNEAARFFYPDQPDTPRSPVDGLVHHTVLADDVAELKLRALAAHATQTADLIARIGRADYREWWRTESFRLAADDPARIAAVAA